MLQTTPLLKLDSLSRLTGCEIYGKAEFLHIGGSVKDRAAEAMLDAALASGELSPGGVLVEGTAGNTGIGLAVYAARKQISCVIVMPDNQSAEKYQTLQALGVELIRVPPCPFSNPDHFYHTARRIAQERGAFWVNQFENTANYRAHYHTTGPEIWEQTSGNVDAFLCAAGTGGTIGGVSRFLKEKNPAVQIGLIDPAGSGLHSYLTTGELKASGSSITEGIGIMRLTENFRAATIDGSQVVNDQDMISMLFHLARQEGLLVGTSSALNAFGAYAYAAAHQGSGKVIVTILCDSGSRYASKIFDEVFLHGKNLDPMRPLPKL